MNNKKNDYEWALETDYLAHHGILGMKWGVRRYQNSDGSLTTLGKARLRTDSDFRDIYTRDRDKYVKQATKLVKKANKQQVRASRDKLKADKLTSKYYSATDDERAAKLQKKANSQKIKASRGELKANRIMSKYISTDARASRMDAELYESTQKPSADVLAAIEKLKDMDMSGADFDGYKTYR